LLGQGAKLDETSVILVVGLGGAILLLIGYLLFDVIRGRYVLRRLAKKRRLAKEAWEREQKSESENQA
jgi:hypothetical protein